MELTVTPKAQKWFESEIDLPETYGIRFFGKVYGKTEVHDGFSIGMSVEQPEHPVKKVEIEGTMFFIEDADEWFFKGYDLFVDYDPKLEEPTYHFKKQ
ncbi:iron-sulfur cluster biosynthesis protein [Enterococcus faecium]|nr:iron-sulfur cluster biosynthesis protein [Enterococcus faecium]EGP5366286.1 iron-sulfur cluster biosynthesis protein [Enterococcus faecium]NTQ55177.1 iron-sulfur cluster biosynthesis protein [Enterococcus faecium]